MRGMPILFKTATRTIRTVADHTNNVALYNLGARYGRSASTSKRRFYAYLRSGRQVTKWIEAKPVASITAAKAVEFISEIIHRFGVMNTIITDNGTQFTAREFTTFCDTKGIKVNYASVAHPQSNGQVERANDMILQELKPRIFDRLKPYAEKWMKELGAVLWGLRTTPSRAIGQSPFTLVYGSEAMLPTEIAFKSLRVQLYNEQDSDDSRVTDLDNIEELREVAVILSARHQQAMRCQ